MTNQKASVVLIEEEVGRRVTPAELRSETATPRLSVVMPVYNERATIAEIIGRVQAVAIEKEIIIVDDGSTDGTREFLVEVASCVRGGLKLSDEEDPIRCDNIRVVFQDRNRGKGAAVRRGFEEATGEYVVVQDGDLELDPLDYHHLIEPLEQGLADVVNGSRFLGATSQVRSLHFFGNRFFTAISNTTTGQELSDVLCCYKMLRREVLGRIRLQEDGFGHESEMTAKLARAGCRICEVPISYDRRTHAQGKKISWKDAFRTTWCILRYGILG